MPNNLLIKGWGAKPSSKRKSTLDNSKNMYQSAFEYVEPFESYGKNSYGLKLWSSVLLVVVGGGDIMHG